MECQQCESGRLACKSTKNPLEHFRKFYADTAIYSTNALTCSYEFFGEDRLLFGSDAPLGPPDAGLTGETIYTIEQMDITVEQREKIFWRNATDLLKVAV